MSETVSTQLRKAIANSKQSHNAIAGSTGVNQAAISRFVKGERGLNSDSIDKLAAHFGLALKPVRATHGK